MFNARGFTDFELRLSESYRPRAYCVQYRESDLNFTTRLLEHEGIYSFYEHSDGKHLLILADGRSAHDSVQGYDRVPYRHPSRSLHTDDHLDDWGLVSQIRPGAFEQTSYDFTAPRKSLLARRRAPKSHAHADLEVFDFQGDYTDAGQGETLARVRLEEQQSNHAVAQATGDARGLTCGAVFSLTEHPRADQNREYLIIGADYRLHGDAFRSDAGGGAGEAVFRVALDCLDARVNYRSPRRTPKPVVQGPQTARVVGKVGEEIWTDQHGRVKVQFHWDRYGQADENSSCWVRVSHPWAGKHWGAISIPRIDQEVIVDFLEGDPDQPIITGRVYNGEQTAPWDLPVNATQSGILSRSSKGAGPANANAIRMEDKKGAEQLWIHAEKDQDLEVENDETHWVGHDRTETVGHDESIAIGSNRTEIVGRNETITIGTTRSENVGAHEVVTVAMTRTHSVGINDMLNVGAAQEVSVGGARLVTVGLAQIVTIGKSLQVSAADAITLTTGDSSITMKKDGTITIQGKDITLTSSGKINIKASGNVVVKGSKVGIN